MHYRNDLSPRALEGEWPDVCPEGDLQTKSNITRGAESGTRDRRPCVRKKRTERMPRCIFDFDYAYFCF
jgi:hypothetical protein